MTLLHEARLLWVFFRRWSATALELAEIDEIRRAVGMPVTVMRYAKMKGMPQKNLLVHTGTWYPHFVKLNPYTIYVDRPRLLRV